MEIVGVVEDLGTTEVEAMEIDGVVKDLGVTEMEELVAFVESLELMGVDTTECLVAVSRVRLEILFFGLFKLSTSDDVYSPMGSVTEVDDSLLTEDSLFNTVLDFD